MGWRTDLWLRLGIGFGVGADFEVVRDPARGTIGIRGRIARSNHAEIREFVERDLAGQGPFAAAGRFGREGRLEVRWAGRIDPFARQRFRNVMIDLLGR